MTAADLNSVERKKSQAFRNGNSLHDSEAGRAGNVFDKKILSKIASMLVDGILR